MKAIESRPRPFSPPVTNGAASSIKIVVAVVIALATAFGLHQWLQPHRLPGAAPQPAAPAAPQRQAPPVAAPSAAPPALPEGTRAITKCVTNGPNGVTSYGDADCARSAKTTLVITKTNQNLLAGMTPEQMAAANRIRPASPVAQQNMNPPGSVASTADECQRIEAEITQLDAQARQPQSGQMQDWIRQQKKELRDRQFRIRCR